ncbi:MAG TPA: hypothetical protein VFP59_13315 [Candidatus Angelobacter sp.]|nr:hypothetical protein [Candidatus Angelobacter sp.]
MAPAREAESSNALLTLDTTAASLPHRLAKYYSQGEVKRPPSGAKAYFATIVLSYVPLLIAGFFSPNSFTTPTSSLKLPFLYDWNIAFMFLVSFPTLVRMTVTDQHVLTSALRQVQRDGILILPADAASSLSLIWGRRFRSINLYSQAVGVIVGVTVAYFNYLVFTPPKVGFWMASQGHLTLQGVVLLWSLCLFYGLVPVYVLRSMAVSFFLKDIVRHAQLHLLPFHPDRSGGLRPVGRLGIRNQYLLTVFGLNVVFLFIITTHYLGGRGPSYAIALAATAAYVILGPFVFLGPLLPFRAGMIRTKSELMSEVAQRLRVELDGVRTKMISGTITKDEEELVDRLRKFGAVIDELPIWPFDAGTLRKFVAAYVFPILGSVGYPLAKALFGKVFQ